MCMESRRGREREDGKRVTRMKRKIEDGTEREEVKEEQREEKWVEQEKRGTGEKGRRRRRGVEERRGGGNGSRKIQTRREKIRNGKESGKERE